MDVIINNLINVGDIINWIYAPIGASMAYLVLHRMQNNRERHVVVKDIESTILALFIREEAKSNRFNDEKEILPVTYRSVLHDNSPWEAYTPASMRTYGNQRYVRIRNCNGIYPKDAR